MIEKIPTLQFDVNSLKDYIKHTIIPNYDITWQNSTYGGWSILSQNGDYKDGWWYAADTIYPDGTVVPALYVYNTEAAIKPTQLYQNILKDVVDAINLSGFKTRRVRLAILKNNTKSVVNISSKVPNMVRLVIPIFTNEQDILYYPNENIQQHLKNDGSIYKYRIDLPHQFINNSDFDRIHLISELSRV